MPYQTIEEHKSLSLPGKIQCQIWVLHAAVQFQWCRREEGLACLWLAAAQTGRSKAVQC